jgi:hypothetical protein
VEALSFLCIFFIYPLLIKLINKVVYIFWMLRLGHPLFQKNHLAQVKNSAAKILDKQSETKMMLEKPWSLATTSTRMVAVASAISGEVILQMPSLPRADSSYATHFIGIVRNTPSLAVMVLERHFARFK